MASTLQSIQDVPMFLWDKATNPNPTWTDLASIVVTTGIFWAIFIAAGARILRSLVAGKPWLAQVATREYHLKSKNIHEDTTTVKEFIEQYCYMWPTQIVVLTQHLVGGLLCFPSVAHLWPDSPEVASSLACLAILSEVGWEIGDLIGLIFQRFCTKGGEKTVTDKQIVCAVMHHSLGMCLGVPLVMYHRDSRVLHLLVFENQVTRNLIGYTTEYLKHLDVNKQSQLIQFQILSFLLLAVAVGTRGFHFLYLCFQGFAVLYVEKNWELLVLTCVISGVFLFFNCFVIIIPLYKKFIKILDMPTSHKNLHEPLLL